MSPVLPPKKDVTLALLERASVFVHLDPRGEEVAVPQWLKKQPQLVLQVGLNMAVNIPDLEVTEEGVSCTLSFNRRPHFCLLPWKAIYALVGEDGRGMIWPENIPAEVASQTNQAGSLRAVDAAAGSTKAAKAKVRPSEAKSQPRLVALKGSGSGTLPSAGSRAVSERPHLRLVK